jgi:hypothetical protein
MSIFAPFRTKEGVISQWFATSEQIATVYVAA